MNKLKILEQWQTTSEALDKASENLLKFGMSIDSETVGAVHNAMDQMTKLASTAVVDAFEVLSWYQHDNKMGALGLQATVNDETREIRTLEDLLWSMDCGSEETPLIVTEPDGSQWVALEDYLKVVGVSERLDDDNDVELWECTKCGRIGSVGRRCGVDTRIPAKYK